MEYFRAKFLVKDLTAGTPLLRGPSKAGLCEWPSLSQPNINIGPSLNLWYRRLGQPHSQVLFTLLNNSHLPFSSKDQFTYYNSCYCNKAYIF